MKRKNTLQEIASAAKVSASTVSRTITGNGDVSQEIQKRVRDAAQRLGVDLNEKLKNRVVAFIIGNSGVLHPFHSRVLAGAEAYCAERGFDLLLILSFRYQPDVLWKDLNLPRALGSRNLARGVILAGTNSSNLLAALAHKAIPFAVLGNNVIGEWEPKKYDVVFSDDIQGSYEMTRYLQSLGHRDIWYVGDRRLPWFSRCGEGYRRAMAAAGLAARFDGFYADDALETGYLSTKAILSRQDPVTAVFAGTDHTAQGVYKALLEAGRRVPEDVTVIGVGDVGATLLSPPLTTIREFPEELGKHLAEMVITRISRRGQPPRQLTIPTEIVKRESSFLPAEYQPATSRVKQSVGGWEDGVRVAEESSKER